MTTELSLLDATAPAELVRSREVTAGNPAMSVPLWWNTDDLPIGVHFLGRFGDETTLIRLAAQLEQAQPWADGLPAIYAAKVPSAKP